MLNNKYIRFIIFVTANFLALGVGVILMDNGPQSEWYTSLNQAPWTPPNWVFGAAWFTIMFLFSFYMTTLSFQFQLLNKYLVSIYSLQWILNVSWNYIFFNKQEVFIGLIVITLLWLLIGYFTFKFIKKLHWYTLLVLPYLIWMSIATSLNAYILFNN
ncbi:TspO/MBR family protein [Tamlana sp. 2_MG-2023]|uniref:TspO/MBR family protein n=1 Tax=unclassified Tamlana TaxID=2614803 RepID=UPI0026E3AF64|nr:MULTISPECIES: TspO/MBR family protein [unclassified Tamlana]MDO6759212.1 TspO/MBR family protein [Tamlana sp. 2_MG-2023]MDO6790649.1 TspO/MBR family protein [Tamlana sp. 1_MG-2023]